MPESNCIPCGDGACKPDPKPVHGATVPLWKRLGLFEFPLETCPFRVGDRVIYTNEFGLQFDMDVIGFSKEIFQGRFIHLARHGRSVDGSAWWFPHRPDELSLNHNA